MSERTSLDDYYIQRVKDAEGYEGALKAGDVEDLPLVEELPPDKEIEGIYPEQDERAKYKIELRIGSKRTMDWMRVRLDLWLSGRMLAGGGDDHMYICGYPDCQSPIPSENLGTAIPNEELRMLIERDEVADVAQMLSGHWAICPRCQSNDRNNRGKQVASPEAVGYKLDKKTGNMLVGTANLVLPDPLTGKKYPCVRDCLMLVGSPEKIAEVVARYWHLLDSNADLYSKYHPKDIRKEWLAGRTRSDQETWDEEDQLVIYSVHNIIKDTSAGADLIQRITAFLRA